jgi:predicted Rossmann fold nucleotide-binding protein DprA/Smf involved in DNA uptake
VSSTARRVGIVGSRRRTDREAVERFVRSLPPGTVVVSGGAIGPDSWAESAAREAGLPVLIFRPDLSGVQGYGESVGRYYARNQQIVDASDEIVAFVSADRKGGTEDTIRRAQKRGLPITIL